MNKYIVKKGDTLRKIAKRNNISLLQLIKLNPLIKNINLIKIGLSINLPSSTQSSSNSNTSTNTSTDTSVDIQPRRVLYNGHNVQRVFKPDGLYYAVYPYELPQDFIQSHPNLYANFHGKLKKLSDLVKSKSKDYGRIWVDNNGGVYTADDPRIIDWINANTTYVEKPGLPENAVLGEDGKIYLEIGPEKYDIASNYSGREWESEKMTFGRLNNTNWEALFRANLDKSLQDPANAYNACMELLSYSTKLALGAVGLGAVGITSTISSAVGGIGGQIAIDKLAKAAGYQNYNDFVILNAHIIDDETTNFILNETEGVIGSMIGGFAGANVKNVGNAIKTSILDAFETNTKNAEIARYNDAVNGATFYGSRMVPHTETITTYLNTGGRSYFGGGPSSNQGMVRGGRYTGRPSVSHGANTNGRVAILRQLTVWRPEVTETFRDPLPYVNYANIPLNLTPDTWALPGYQTRFIPQTKTKYPAVPIPVYESDYVLEEEYPLGGWAWWNEYRKHKDGETFYWPGDAYRDSGIYRVLRTRPDIIVTRRGNENYNDGSVAIAPVYSGNVSQQEVIGGITDDGTLHLRRYEGNIPESGERVTPDIIIPLNRKGAKLIKRNVKRSKYKSW